MQILLLKMFLCDKSILVSFTLSLHYLMYPWRQEPPAKMKGISCLKLDIAELFVLERSFGNILEKALVQEKIFESLLEKEVKSLVFQL